MAYGESVNTKSLTFAAMTGDQAILAQWVELCLLTDQGTCWSAPEYGYGLLALVGKSFTADELLSEQARAVAAITFDERIASCEATLTPTYLGGGQAAVKLELKVTPKDPNVSAFLFTTTASADVVTSYARGL